MTDKKKTTPITEHPNFITYDNFISGHTQRAEGLGITDKGTLTWYYKGTMDGVLYDIGKDNGHKGMKLYWEIMNTIRCITLPREIFHVGRDKVKELRIAELDKLEQQIVNHYKKYESRGNGLAINLNENTDIGTPLSPEESMEWLTGIVALRCLGMDSSNEFGESITWGISPDDMCEFGGNGITTPQPTPSHIEEEVEKVLGIGKFHKKKKKKKPSRIVTEEEGSTADTQDLADWIEGKTSKKPTPTIIHTGGATDGSEVDSVGRCSECNKEWEEYLTPSDQVGGCVSYGKCKECRRSELTDGY